LCLVVLYGLKCTTPNTTPERHKELLSIREQLEK
jgi:hypothetical protein